MVSPPSRQAATLSGWPSSSVGQPQHRRRRQPVVAADDERPGGQHAGDDRGGADEPRPRPCGIRLAQTQLQAARPAAELVERGAHRLDHQVRSRRAGPRPRPRRRPRRRSPAVGDLDDDVVVQREREAERVEAGPRLALVAGTRTRTGAARKHRLACHLEPPQARPSAAAAATASTGTVTRRRRAGDGPLRVLEPVAGDGAHDGLTRVEQAGRSCACSSPATEAADAGSTNTPSRAPAAGRPRGSRRSVTASIRPPDSSRAATRLVPRRRVADPDRGGDGRRVARPARRRRSARRRRPGSPTSAARRDAVPSSAYSR